MVISPDGSRLVTASLDGTVKVWEVGSDEPVLSVSGHNDLKSVMALAFVQNENRLVVASLNRIFLYNLELKDLIALEKMRIGQSLTEDERKEYQQRQNCPSMP